MTEKRYIYVYDLRHLYSGISFDAVSIDLSNPDRLRAKELRQFGRDYDSPNLATKGGLEHPIAIYVDRKHLAFVPEIEIVPLESGEHITDPVAYGQMRQRALGDRPFPETLKGSNFEIWA